MGRCTWMLVLLLGSSALAEPPSPAPGTAPATTTQPLRVWPWIEVSSGVPNSVDDCVRGLLIWQELTDTAIVSVDPGDLGVFRTVAQRVPRIHILPGIKTSPVLRRTGLDSVAGWREIGRAAEAACRMTGSKTYVLENESAIQDFMRGKYEMNWERLREALRTLPADIPIVWNPCVGETGDILERLVRFCEVVDQTCNVRFVEPSIALPSDVNTSGMNRLMGRLHAVSSHPTIPIVHCMSGNRFWTLAQIPDALRLVPGDTVIVYPGAKHWIAAARAAMELKASLPARMVKPAPAENP